MLTHLKEWFNKIMTIVVKNCWKADCGYQPLIFCRDFIGSMHAFPINKLWLMQLHQIYHELPTQRWLHSQEKVKTIWLKLKEKNHHYVIAARSLSITSLLFLYLLITDSFQSHCAPYQYLAMAYHCLFAVATNMNEMIMYTFAALKLLQWDPESRSHYCMPLLLICT